MCCVGWTWQELAGSAASSVYVLCLVWQYWQVDSHSSILCHLIPLSLFLHITATALTGVALILSLSLAATDDRVSLFPDQPSLWWVSIHSLTHTFGSWFDSLYIQAKNFCTYEHIDTIVEVCISKPNDVPE